MPAGIWEILQLELSELVSIDIDIDPTLTGFSTGEIDVILSSAGDPDDEGHPSRSDKAARTKLGDIWILGDHRVGCGGRPRCWISTAGSSAMERVLMPLSWILPTMYGLGGMQWLPEAIENSPWPPVR